MLVCLEYQCNLQEEDTAKILNTDTFEIYDVTRVELFDKFIDKGESVYNLICEPQDRTVDKFLMKSEGGGKLISPYYFYKDWCCITVDKYLHIYYKHKFIWQSDMDYTDLSYIDSDIQPVFSRIDDSILGLIIKANSTTAYLELYTIQNNRLIKLSDKNKLSNDKVEDKLPWDILGRKYDRCELMSGGNLLLFHNYELNTYFYFNLDDLNFYMLDKKTIYKDYTKPPENIVNLLFAPFIKNMQDTYKTIKDSMIILKGVRKYTCICLQYQGNMLNYMLREERKKLCERLKIFDIQIVLERDVNAPKVLNAEFDITSYTEPFTVYNISGGKLCL